MSEAIVPNSTVWLMSGVPLDNTYRHSLYFATETDQRNTFLSVTSPHWIIATFTHQMYKRVNRGTIRVAYHAELLHQCNYMAFINRAVDADKYPNGKMFYAFVTEVNYINEAVTEIKYELDYIQSYFFEIEIAPCTVEREHTYTDKRYEHTVPENLGLGEYEISGSLLGEKVTLQDGQQVDLFDDLAIFVAATCRAANNVDPNSLSAGDYDIEKTTGGWQGGIFCGTATAAFYPHLISGTPETWGTVAARLRTYLDKIDDAGFSDGVVNIFLAPRAFWGVLAKQNYFGDQIVEWETSITDPPWLYRSTGLTNSPTVVNNKCYCYPFNFLLAVSSDGDVAEYKYELSALSHPQYSDRKQIFFYLDGSINSECELLIRPESYRNIAAAVGIINNVDTLRCNKNPLCSWNSDTYKCWLAQHKMGMLAGGITSVVDAGVGIASAAINMHAGIGAKPKAALGKSIMGGVASVANYAIKTCVGEMGDAKAHPNTQRGDVSGIMEIANRTYGIHFYRSYVKPEFMAIIDDYFTKFGYAVKILKKPSIHNRLEYTYVKTIDAEIMPKDNNTKTCPNDVNDVITEVYNNGITFWVNWNHVGDYSVSNTPLGDVSPTP